jgi:hypothetical protein
MLCPCCGNKIAREARACGCGARFVGRPLGENPFKVRRYGPVLTAIFSSAAVAVAAFAISRWAMSASVLAVWAAWRATRLARGDRELYGGYRAAVATLAIAIVGALAAASYAVAQIPHYLEMRRARQVTLTEASMYRTASLLEKYRRTYGSYPRNADEIKKVFGEPMPADYWEQAIKYQSYTEALADGSIGLSGIPLNSFELRSPGPDGKEDTDDDIIMRNGLFYTNAQAKKSPVIYNSPDY